MGLVVTVEGSWEISDSFLVTWCNMKCHVFWDKRDVIFVIVCNVETSMQFWLRQLAVNNLARELC